MSYLHVQQCNKYVHNNKQQQYVSQVPVYSKQVHLHILCIIQLPPCIVRSKNLNVLHSINNIGHVQLSNPFITYLPIPACTTMHVYCRLLVTHDTCDVTQSTSTNMILTILQNIYNKAVYLVIHWLKSTFLFNYNLKCDNYVSHFLLHF